MIARFGLLSRHPDLSPQAFDSHWRDAHGPLAAQFPGLRAYFQHVIIRRGPPLGRGIPDWQHLDGLSELHFDDIKAMTAAVDSAAFRSLLPDETNFLRDLRLVACHHETVRPADLDYPAGCMILIRNHDDDLSANQGGGGQLACPECTGTFCNTVIERYVRGQSGPASRDKVPLDALTHHRFADDAASSVFLTRLASDYRIRSYDAVTFQTQTRRIL